MFFLRSFLFAFCLLLVPAAVSAADTIKYETVDQTSYFKELQDQGITFAFVSDACKTKGNCRLEDIMQVFTNIANFILGIVGSIALIITVYGGFLWLTSQGSSEQIAQGKTAMTGSVIGLLIVFGAFAGINLITGAVRGGDADQTNYCELVSPDQGGKAGMGYACLNTGTIDTSEYSCLDNLCPGDATIKCCIKGESSTSSTAACEATCADATTAGYYTSTAECIAERCE